MTDSDGLNITLFLVKLILSFMAFNYRTNETWLKHTFYLNYFLALSGTLDKSLLVTSDDEIFSPRGTSSFTAWCDENQ